MYMTAASAAAAAAAAAATTRVCLVSRAGCYTGGSSCI